MTEFENNINQIINTPQSLYDAFNELMFSKDTKVIGKFISKIELFNMVKNIPGDIVECGVFKGSGILGWLKIKKILDPNTFKKVIGFDFFDTQSLISSLEGDDRDKMDALFKSRDFQHGDKFVKMLHNKIIECGFSSGDFELVEGDVMNSTYDFVSKRPGFKISLLYLDLDLEKPTYATLTALWERVSRGGVVVFDEYAYHQWSESKGVDKFFEDKDIIINNLNFQGPTAYIIKN
tara:strand:- start:101 stop:805 length:705 start_codon:yes stop_codon:yes gene_type:complete